MDLSLQRERSISTHNSDSDSNRLGEEDPSIEQEDEPKKEKERRKQERWAHASKNAGLFMSVHRVGKRFRDSQRRQITENGTVFFTAVLEYLAAELLELSGDAAKSSPSRSGQIKPTHLTQSILSDPDLLKLLVGDFPDPSSSTSGSSADLKVRKMQVQAVFGAYAEEAEREKREEERVFEALEGALEGLSLANQMTTEKSASSPLPTETTSSVAQVGEGEVHMLNGEGREAKGRTDGYATA